MVSSRKVFPISPSILEINICKPPRKIPPGDPRISKRSHYSKGSVGLWYNAAYPATIQLQDQFTWKQPGLEHTANSSHIAPGNLSKSFPDSSILQTDESPVYNDVNGGGGGEDLPITAIRWHLLHSTGINLQIVNGGLLNGAQKESCWNRPRAHMLLHPDYRSSQPEASGKPIAGPSQASSLVCLQQATEVCGLS